MDQELLTEINQVWCKSDLIKARILWMRQRLQDGFTSSSLETNDSKPKAIPNDPEDAASISASQPNRNQSYPKSSSAAHASDVGASTALELEAQLISSKLLLAQAKFDRDSMEMETKNLRKQLKQLDTKRGKMVSRTHLDSDHVSFLQRRSSSKYGSVADHGDDSMASSHGGIQINAAMKVGASSYFYGSLEAKDGELVFESDLDGTQYAFHENVKTEDQLVVEMVGSRMKDMAPMLCEITISPQDRRVAQKFIGFHDAFRSIKSSLMEKRSIWLAQQRQNVVLSASSNDENFHSNTSDSGVRSGLGWSADQEQDAIETAMLMLSDDKDLVEHAVTKRKSSRVHSPDISSQISSDDRKRLAEFFQQDRKEPFALSALSNTVKVDGDSSHTPFSSTSSLPDKDITSIASTRSEGSIVEKKENSYSRADSKLLDSRVMKTIRSWIGGSFEQEGSWKLLYRFLSKPMENSAVESVSRAKNLCECLSSASYPSVLLIRDSTENTFGCVLFSAWKFSRSMDLREHQLIMEYEQPKSFVFTLTPFAVQYRVSLESSKAMW
eukprot:CAMPEP_0184694142 /NCGR_PEP_ID=MMETSP0313-20130426/2190_1 /TAXON_ID=2792 /ORGANISM="Porphyridium aerugineum, Strain SAG 1380-2" /LENGTH=553 /DNA_ID=CAMNT_0027152379 /DNA_START=136 /DNA_END=1794 /DNA_ORIENTATION=-